MSDMYFQALVGGLILGAGAILLMLTLGKVAGISGIAYSAVSSFNTKNLWRWAFLFGLVIAPLITSTMGYSIPSDISASPMLMAIAGLLVGLGSKIGSGCTSGHGICGIGRLSKRSIVATLTFMGTAILTVALVRHLI